MKLQGFSVIFVLIVVPLVLILSFYIQMQVDTIALQTSYDTMLLDATYDAMSAFELNTSNEDLSSVSDSLRSIIQASNNIFTNILATDLGMSNASKIYVQQYVPAILYTLYDGYYIYSPTNTPEVLTDPSGVAVTIEEQQEGGKEVFSTAGLNFDGNYYTYDKANAESDSPTKSVIRANVPEEDFGQILYKTSDDRYTTNLNDESVVYKTDYLLKSYNPYTARYVKNNIDVTINYTLDNFITVEGNIGNIYYAKSGYLIAPNRVTDVKVTNKDGLELGYDICKINESDAERLIESGEYNVSLKVDGQEISLDTSALLFASLATLEEKVESLKENIAQLEYQRKYGSFTNVELAKLNGYYEEYQRKYYHIQNINAVTYYIKAKIFSTWVYENLGELTQGNTVQNVISDYDYVSVLSEEAGVDNDQSAFLTIFDPIDTTKIFDVSEDPEEEESKFNRHKYSIIKNSIQYNLNLAMSTYNVTATTDQFFSMPVIPEDEWDRILSNVSITSFMQGLKCGLKTYNNYAIVSSTNNEITSDVDELFYVKNLNFNDENAVYHKIDCPNFEFDESAAYISVTSKEVKYDRVFDKSIASDFYKYDHKNLVCYTCGIDGNYISVDDENLAKRKKTYYISVGAQREGLYKMNAVKENEGFEIIYDLNTDISKTSLKEIKYIKRIEITFGNIPTADWQDTTVNLKFSSTSAFPQTTYVLNTNQSKEQTLTVLYDGYFSENLSKMPWRRIKVHMKIERCRNS